MGTFAAIPVRVNGDNITYAWFNLLRTAGVDLVTLWGLTSTATAAGTTTLTVSSTKNQRFTGVTTQNIVLPVATTLAAGDFFRIINESTGILTVKYQDGTTLATVAPSSEAVFMVATVATSNGVWWIGPKNIIAKYIIATEKLDVASAASITQLASTQSFVKLTGATVTTIHGIAAGIDGQTLTLHNGSSAIATIKHQSGTAAAADRLILPNAVDLSVAANSSAEFIYDSTQSRWVQKSGSGSGAGGGASITLIEDTDAPESVILAGRRYYKLVSGLTQYLYASVRVPSTYIAGSPIKMRVRGFARALTDTILLQSLATLNRTGTDAITSTTNQRTSTNAAAANVVDTPQNFLLDLTGTDGTINSVAVAAGDEISARLQRGTDVNTNDLYVEALSVEVTFSA